MSVLGCWSLRLSDSLSTRCMSGCNHECAWCLHMLPKLCHVCIMASHPIVLVCQPDSRHMVLHDASLPVMSHYCRLPVVLGLWVLREPWRLSPTHDDHPQPSCASLALQDLQTLEAVLAAANGLLLHRQIDSAGTVSGLGLVYCVCCILHSMDVSMALSGTLVHHQHQTSACMLMCMQTTHDTIHAT